MQLFRGEQRIRPEDISEQNPLGLRRDTNDTVIHARVITRDFLGKFRVGLQVTLIALEFQSNVHYAMPLRVLNSDSAGYDTQWRKIWEAHKDAGDLQGAEYLSGFGKNDRLTPVLTIVLYFGANAWDGPRTLKEMLDLENCPPEVSQQIIDYPLHLIEVRNYPHMEKFQTDLRYTFGFLHRAENKQELMEYVSENESVFSHLDGNAYQLLRVMSNSGKILREKENYENDGGDYDMCQALLDMMEDSKAQGISIGEARGISIGESRGIQLAKEVIRLQMAGKSAEEIAAICQIPAEKVEEILR